MCTSRLVMTSRRQARPVYKVGVSRVLNTLMCGSPKHTKLILCQSVKSAQKFAAKRAVLCAFKATFIQRKDIGKEYFEVHDESTTTMHHLFSTALRPYLSLRLDSDLDSDLSPTAGHVAVVSRLASRGPPESRGPHVNRTGYGSRFGLVVRPVVQL